MTTLRGPLEVTTESEPPFVEHDGVTVNRNTLRKAFPGGLDGSSEAQMIEGEPQLKVVIVPGTGTGELSGIAGTLEIPHDNGEHTYVLEYDLP